MGKGLQRATAATIISHMGSDEREILAIIGNGDGHSASKQNISEAAGFQQTKSSYDFLRNKKLINPDKAGRYIVGWHLTELGITAHELLGKTR